MQGENLMDTATLADKEHAVRDRLSGSLHDMVADVEALLKTAQRSGSEQVVAARDKVESRLHQARGDLAALQDTASYNVRRAARAADGAVHEHPYAAAGLAAGIGVLVGMLISRR
jgi:ElaB/YqjD/DUF883 family membrane-anchored ribosome-binding protein